jgi:hypothetical protein
VIPRVAALLVALLVAGSSIEATAAPISLSAYREVLLTARAEVDAARQTSGDQRRAGLDVAVATLQGVSEVEAAGATFTALPHEPIVSLLRSGDDSSLARASGMLDETIGALSTASGSVVDPDQARAVLEATLRSSDFRRQPSWIEALAELLRDLLGRLFPNVRVPTISEYQIAVPLAGVITLLLVIIAVNAARGLRAKVTREAVLAAAAVSERARATDHLRAADDAIRERRLREALHHLFLASLAGLEERAGLRLDPSLTDREILARAAGSPRAEDLGALVALYEPAWYGVREPTPAEIDRAGDLARRIGR